MKRIRALDVLKYFACFLVVCIHMELPKSFEWIARPLLTTAVPVFFMITGFFYSAIRQAGKTKTQIKKITILALAANALHLGYAVCKCVTDMAALQELGRQILAPAALVELLLFNQPVWRTSLWFINALLYVLVCICFIERGAKIFKLYPLIPVLLVGNLVLGTYGSVIPTVSQVPLCYSRNFLFCGLPYFLLGSYLSCHKEWLRLGSWKYCGLFLLLGYAELFLLEKFGVLHYSDHLVSTFFLSVSVFCFFLNREHAFTGTVWTAIAELGRKHCFVIYITHSVMIEVCYKAVAILSKWIPFLPRLWAWTGPVLILAAATVFAMLLGCFTSKEKLQIRH